MSAQIIPFAPARPFVEVEHLGASKATGRPAWFVNFHESEANGGGQANGVGDAESFDDAMAVAREWGLPIRLHPSTAQGCQVTALGICNPA